jgi:hypothetical protein
MAAHEIEAKEAPWGFGAPQGDEFNHHHLSLFS